VTIAFPRTRLHQLDIERFAEVVHLCDQLWYLTIKSARNVLHCAIDAQQETRARLPVESANTYRVHGWTMTTTTHLSRAQLGVVVPAILALADPASQSELEFNETTLLPTPPVVERIVHRGSDALVLRLSDPTFALHITTLVLGSSVSDPVQILDFGYLGRSSAPFEVQLVDALTEAVLPNLERLEVQTWGTSGMFPRGIAALVRKNGARLRTLALPAGRAEAREWIGAVLGVTNRALRELVLDISTSFDVREGSSVDIEKTLDEVMTEGGLRGLRSLKLRRSQGGLDFLRDRNV